MNEYFKSFVVLVVFVGGKTLTFLLLSGGFFSVLGLKLVGFLVWVVLGVVGEDIVEDTSVFSGGPFWVRSCCWGCFLTGLY
jgi:hypothetical protein